VRRPQDGRPGPQDDLSCRFAQVYGNIGFAKVLPSSRIDTIITHCGLRDEDRLAVEELGLEVMTV
jgi:DeoR/GlpR family transcriptional regulator of sugar metabolism